MPRNFEAEMVMKGLNVVGAIGGTVEVIGEAAETASGMGTGGIVSIRSSPCSVGTGVDYAYSVCGGTRGATMGGAPGGAKWPAN